MNNHIAMYQNGEIEILRLLENILLMFLKRKNYKKMQLSQFLRQFKMKVEEKFLSMDDILREKKKIGGSK